VKDGSSGREGEKAYPPSGGPEGEAFASWWVTADGGWKTKSPEGPYRRGVGQFFKGLGRRK